jgi:hypothetical protein
MLLLDDGTHFTHHPFAATNSAKASHQVWLDWLQQLPIYQVFPDRVVYSLMLVLMVRMRVPVMQRDRIVKRQVVQQ